MAKQAVIAIAMEKATVADVENLIPGLLQAAAFAAKFTRTPKDDLIVARLKELYGDGTLVKVLLKAINGK